MLLILPQPLSKNLTTKKNYATITLQIEERNTHPFLPSIYLRRKTHTKPRDAGIDFLPQGEKHYEYQDS